MPFKRLQTESIFEIWNFLLLKSIIERKVYAEGEMKMIEIKTNDAPLAIGPYSQAVGVSN